MKPSEVLTKAKAGTQEHADDVIAGLLDQFGGYVCQPVDEAILYMQERGKDRWSMQALMDAERAFAMPNCRSCDVPAGIKDPAELIADAGTKDQEPYPWPLCRGHEPYALVAGWKVYELTDPQAHHLVEMLKQQALSQTKEAGNG